MECVANLLTDANHGISEQLEASLYTLLHRDERSTHSFIEDSSGRTPLELAEESGYTECANLLRQQMKKDEESINLAPDEYNNAILNAAQQGDSRTLRRLIAAGADVNATNSWGFTPLAETAAHGYVECMKLFRPVVIHIQFQIQWYCSQCAPKRVSALHLE